MTDHGALTDLLVIFAVSIAVVFAFHKLRLPSIAGFLVAGALIGPHGLNLVSDLDQVKVLAEIGVVLLLFTIGVEFSLAHIVASRALLLIGGPLQLIGTLVMITGVAMLLGLPARQAVFWGCLVALSSTAIVLKALAERGENESLHGRATIGILIFQDLAVVPMMLMVPLLARADATMGADVFIALGKSAVLVTLIVGTGWFVVPRLLEHIVRSRSRELFLLTVIVLCLGIAWLTSLAGLSLALGAFIAGLVISESEYSHQALAEVLPFRDSFNSLFFVSIGMLMDIRTILAHPALVLALVVTILLVKFVIASGSVLAMGSPPRVGILAGIALAQVGEFAFILAQEGQEEGLLDADHYQVFLAMSVITMVVTPFLIYWAPKLARRVEAVQRVRHWFPDRTVSRMAQMESRYPKVRDHVIILGYGLNGSNLARVLRESEIPFVVLEMNADIVRREAAKGLPMYYGDGTNPTLLHQMRIEDAKVLVVAISDPFDARRAVQLARRLNPNLHIVVRTRYLKELDELHRLGANEVVPEEFETSIEIFALVLRTYKMPQDLVMQKAERIRREGYAALRRGELPELAHHLRGGTLADVEVETVRLEEGSPGVGKTLEQIAVRPRTGASVMALTRRGVTDSNPSHKTTLEVGDIVVLLGSREQIRRAISLLVEAGTP